ncbi:hypothetical protein D9619_006842 [Psilocybe cf. subviscida]|uniref:Aminotransferase class V domain-containing protein n=1 Tax=Psilocybe cf. subviscida TaxID=2480587 RepID=A0A8H5B4S6_9AGAR|nr:hypothetical protein D9619_006842 [Psilocybe cf. subviscida]
MQLKKDLYSEEAPPFGHELLKHFAIDPEYTNLNHGSYGTTPRPVIEATNELTLRVESNADLFHRIEYLPLLVEARTQVAELIGAERDEVVFVTNASMGVATVMRNFEWEEGDMIFAFTTTYNSVLRTAHYISDVLPHPKLVTIPIGFPTTHAEIIQNFKEYLDANPANPNKRRVAVIDSIVSNPGCLLPWKEMTKIAKDANVWSVVDAAHSIGQEVGLNLTEAAPDFWISNCHKWLSAKRSCAVLYVPFRNQHIIKTSIPTASVYISPKDRNGLPNFVEQFDCKHSGHGTIDWAPYLTVVDALRFRKWLGGEEKINAYCHDLALKGGKRLAEVLGTQVMDPSGESTLNMVNVALPLPNGFEETYPVHAFMRKEMLDRKAFSAHFKHNGQWWTRCSAQVFTELSDFEIVGQRWLEVCDAVKKEFGLE